MGDHMEAQVHAVFQPRAKVYCGTCRFYVPSRVTQQGSTHVLCTRALCRHPDATSVEDTYEGLTLVYMPPALRNKQNDCQDWRRRTFWSDIDRNPLKQLMLVLAALALMVGLLRVFGL